MKKFLGVNQKKFFILFPIFILGIILIYFANDIADFVFPPGDFSIINMFKTSENEVLTDGIKGLGAGLVAFSFITYLMLLFSDVRLYTPALHFTLFSLGMIMSTKSTISTTKLILGFSPEAWFKGYFWGFLPSFAIISYIIAVILQIAARRKYKKEYEEKRILYDVSISIFSIVLAIAISFVLSSVLFL